ncbi:MAG TPA: 2-oxoacid:acceptor oxidoreductase subunit alpha [Thermoanaerobaculia bacterium]|nr:2-oxoacid:acceptor oxidoreductase subunit alpha [Thermoanaerobaculia bacterium]
MSDQLTLSIVGSGGDGAVAAGDILAMACARNGLHVIKTEAYGPQIRGGESSCTVRISARPIYAQADTIDAVVIFSWADFARFRSELVLASGAIVIYDTDDPPPDEVTNAIAVPFAKLTRELGAPAGKNVLALGILGTLFGLPVDSIRAAVKRRFGKKAQAVQEANLRVFDAGIAKAAELGIAPAKLDYTAGPPRLVISGNEASAFGAIDAGCRFFAGYPITPSSEILHMLAEWLPKLGGSSLQTEDELSAIGAVIGASFAGVKSMTATSGPGLSLMSEMLGLASISETPAVIVNVQRGGPSTGVPTKSEQSDLFHAVFAGHGDTPRVVISATDVEDAYHATVDAFNIAEQFQTPVIVLTDQLIGQRRETIDAAAITHEVKERRLVHPEDLENFQRYRETPDGVSPMSIPGIAGGMYQTNGLEHDERGRPNSNFLVHEKMNAKRYRKLDAIAKKYPLFKRFGPENPELGIVCWGSSTGAVREAIDTLNARGARVAAFVPQMIEPLPAAELQKFVDSCANVLVVELSFAAQFHQFLRTKVDLPRAKTHVYARSGCRSLGVKEVIAEAARLLPTAKLEEVLA